MNITRTLLTSLTLAAVLGAQEEAARTTTQSSAPLRLASTDPGLVLGLAYMMGGEQDPPQLEDGQVAVITLDDGGVPSISTAAGTKYLEVHARPAMLAAMFPDAIEGARAEMEQAMTGAMAMSGQDPEGAMAFAEFLFAMPKQIESLHFTLPENPEEDFSIDADLELTPVADSMFAKIHGALENTERGIPQLPMKDAWMTFDMDLDYSKLGPYLQEFTDLYLEMMGVSLDGDTAATVRKSWADMWKATSGSMSMGWSFERGLVALIDAGSDIDVASIMSSDDYQKMTKELGEQQGMTTTISEDGEHRGAKIWKVAMSIPELAMIGEMMPFPMLEGDAIVQRMASSGRYTMFTMFGAGKDELKPLIENAADNKIQHRKSDSLMSMYMDLGAMIGRMSEMLGEEPDGDMPQTVEMAVKKTKTSLKIEVDIR